MDERENKRNKIKTARKILKTHKIKEIKIVIKTTRTTNDMTATLLAALKRYKVAK